VANVLPQSYVSNALITKSTYISTLAADKTQFLPDGLMPAGGPAVIMAISKLAGVVTGPVNLGATYTNSFAVTANKDLGYKG
jgi:NitT/TauT family transport system substrate-binding protein